MQGPQLVVAFSDTAALDRFGNGYRLILSSIPGK